VSGVLNMLEFGNETDCVSLTVVDYQRENAEEAFDRNWLIVEATRTVGDHTKVLRDPALLTSELRDIRHFFQGAGETHASGISGAVFGVFPPG